MISAVPGGGILSTSFNQPVGRNFEPGRLGGYYIDLTVKADAPDWPPPSLQPLARQLHVDVFQWGLGCYERWLDGEGDRWLEGALALGEHMLVEQAQPGGGFEHREPYPHTYDLRAPWLSAMAQGQAASLLVRLHRESGDDRFAAAARHALKPLALPVEEGGVRRTLDGGWWLEEYPTEPASYVLNGGIFALWGYLDVASALGDSEARREFEDGVDALARNIGRWDTGSWSRYDLFPHPVMNTASPAYHELHIHQLRALNLVAPRSQVESVIERFEAYASSRARRAAAFVRKVRFRLAVPRRRKR